MKIVPLINACLFSNPEEIHLPDTYTLFSGGLENQDLDLFGNTRYILFGSISNMYEAFQLDAGYDPGLFVSYFLNHEVTDYIYQIKDHALNNKGYFKLPHQLDYEDLGKFIKSNSGNKVLTGQILDESLYKMITSGNNGILPHDLLFIHEAHRYINREFRFWIFEDEIVTASEYSWDENHDYLDEIPKEAYDFVNKVIQAYTPDIAFTIDIVSDVPCSDQYRVVEFNSYSTSGFYKADVKKIVEPIINVLNK